MKIDLNENSLKEWETSQGDILLKKIKLAIEIWSCY